MPVHAAATKEGKTLVSMMTNCVKLLQNERASSSREGVAVALRARRQLSALQTSEFLEVVEVLMDDDAVDVGVGPEDEADALDVAEDEAPPLPSVDVNTHQSKLNR